MSGEFDLGIAGLDNAMRIGEGGNAVVYSARQSILDRRVAVKVLKQVDTNTSRRFDRERRAMGRLSQHDGIVTVYETGYTDSGYPFLVMPLLEGALDDEMKTRGAFPWEEAASLMSEVCSTIAFAHDEGVVHRDIKPGNLMRTQTGRVLVSDFGISRITNTATAMMETALTLTPAYSPPEAMNVGETRPASDIYSLGATLYALLAGHPPFMPPHEEVPVFALMRRIAEEPVQPLPPWIPVELSRAVLVSLAKSPDDRFGSAHEMASALSAIEADPPSRPLQPQPPPVPPRSEPPRTQPPPTPTSQPPPPIGHQRSPMTTGPVSQPPPPDPSRRSPYD